MSQVQFISYCVNIGYKTVNGQKTYPSLDNDSEDIKERINHLFKVINEVMVEPTVISDQSVKKIFMIPEFFFRGKKGYYTLNEKNSYSDNLLPSLQSFLKGTTLNNWIFIFGTTVYGWNKGTDTYIYNSSLVQEVGYTLQEEAYKLAHLVQKEFKSKIDFIEYESNPYIYLEPMPSNSLGTELQKRGYDGSSIFNLSSIPVKVGLEICLDHAKARLKNTTTKPEGKDIKIQLIPSAGMTIKKENIAVVNGGYVFNCDGLNSNVLDLATEGKKKDPDLIGKNFNFHSQLLKRSSSSYEEIRPKGTFEVKFDQEAKNLFSGESGQVYIYEPQDI
ncbi:MAG: hypothetical protein F6K54_20535 [Okeania sp. SIO3B5]|uniref:hypothetical protein n=1 Tax=Okeania sp. SIO3B5 TaxID=2607811 RepID=UPI00140193C9|nr:hypothetical protein [Okeania sp. SIO3B5]NEO55251.1 hypothetical protein [Okeania sp. SIO3B5]